MRQFVLGMLAGALLACVLGAVPLAAAPTHAFQVPEGKYLGLEIPEGLSVESRLEIDQILEIEIRPEDGSYEFQIATLPTLWPHPDDEHEGTWIRDWIPRVARTEFDVALEGELELLDLEHPIGVGFYTRFANPHLDLPECEYRDLIIGGVVVKALWIWFALGSDVPGDEVAETALEIVRSASYGWFRKAPLVGVTPGRVLPGSYELELPGQEWALLVDLPGFEVKDVCGCEDGSSTWLRARHPDTGIAVSAILRPEADRVPSVLCRARYFTRRYILEEDTLDFRKYEGDLMAFGEYRVREKWGRRVNERHIHAYRAAPGAACLEVEVYKRKFKEADREHYSAIFDSIRFVESGRLSPAPEEDPEGGRR